MGSKRKKKRESRPATGPTAQQPAHLPRSSTSLPQGPIGRAAQRRSSFSHFVYLPCGPSAQRRRQVGPALSSSTSHRPLSLRNGPNNRRLSTPWPRPLLVSDHGPAFTNPAQPACQRPSSLCGTHTTGASSNQTRTESNSRRQELGFETNSGSYRRPNPAL